MYKGKKKARNKHHVKVVPTTRENLPSVAADYYKQLRVRSTGERKHARMLAAKNFKPKPIRPTKEEFDRKYSACSDTHRKNRGKL